MPNPTFTFLFTDLEDSTPLWEQHPIAMQHASARHDALLRAIIESHGGRVIKSTGDGFHAVFTAPPDAVAATLAGQRAILAEPWPADLGPLQVRMGLHTGEGQERAGDYYGVDVNRAARIMGLGFGGQVLLSYATAALVRRALPEDCSLLDLGEQRLKGIAALERVFQLAHPDLRADFPPVKSLAIFKHNLPHQLTTFIGREAEIARVKELLAATRLLTLLGPGGTGKTRLMLQTAEEAIEDYPDGVWLVELAPLTDPQQIPERVSSALRVQEQPGRRPLDTLIEYLRRKELLLLLDNVEHLVHESAQLAEHLLANCPRLTILVTGREALFIAGETTLQIPSLSVPGRDGHPTLETIRASEGVQFFVDRGRAVNPDFALTAQNAPAIAEIVQRLDGIPLALELAAARLRMLTVEQIAARLNDRFRLLTGGRRTALPRQQTLEALIDWSWNLLSEAERVLLRRLSVFAGGWTLEAAQTVAGFDPLDEYTVFDELEQLINKSLVVVQHVSGNPVGLAKNSRGEVDANETYGVLRGVVSEARYGMLESIHQYAQGKLLEAGEAETLRERHVAYFVALGDAQGALSFDQDYYAWREMLAPDGDNLRAVMDWIAEARPGLALHFAGTIHQYELGWMPFREVRSWLQPAIEHAATLLDSSPAQVNMADYIRALQAYGWLLVTHGEMADGLPILDEGIRLAREHDEFALLAFALGMKAQAMGTNVTPDIISQLEDAIARCRLMDDELLLVTLLFFVGSAYLSLRDLPHAVAWIDEASHIVGGRGKSYFMTWMLIVQGNIALASQDPARAEELMLLAEAALERANDQRLLVTTRSELAHLYRTHGRSDEALALYLRTILAWQEQGHQSAVAHQLECFAYIAVERGQYEPAAQLIGAARHARQRLNALSTNAHEIAELEGALSRLEAEMSADALERMLSRGEQMSLDEAVEFALQPR